MRSSAALLALVACYAPHAPSGAPCADDGSCPTGLQCIAGACTSTGMPIDAADPTCRCNASTLSCATGDTECGLGCIGDPIAHCGKLVPSNSLTLDDTLGLASVVTIDAPTVIDGDTGAITGGLTRAAGSGVDADVRYEVVGSLAVFAFHGLDITQTGSVRLAGTMPIAFLVATTATIDGSIDGAAGCGSGDRACPGPGGGAGAIATAMAGGCGAGGSGATTAPTNGPDGGGGGGGGGGAGASGGTVNESATVVANGGAGGVGCIASTLEPLVGGSGGAGGGAGGAPMAPRGGGGGGALQISAQDAVSIAGSIDLGGGGGDGGQGSSATGGAAAGGGGGAGGALLVEATAITITGVVAANGGGGGGGGLNIMPGGDGLDGSASALPAGGGAGAGSATGTKGGNGGSGGAGSAAAGTGQSLSGNTNGGGGGGGFGRIFVRAAMLATTGATVSPDAGSDVPRVR